MVNVNEVGAAIPQGFTSEYRFVWHHRTWTGLLSDMLSRTHKPMCLCLEICTRNGKADVHHNHFQLKWDCLGCCKLGQDPGLWMHGGICHYQSKWYHLTYVIETFHFPGRSWRITNLIIKRCPLKKKKEKISQWAVKFPRNKSVPWSCPMNMQAHQHLLLRWPLLILF